MNADGDRVSAAVIENCRLVDSCAQRWDALEALPGEPLVRFCSRCQSAVHLALDGQREVELAQQGKCFVVHVVPRDAEPDARQAPAETALPPLCTVTG